MHSSQPPTADSRTVLCLPVQQCWHLTIMLAKRQQKRRAEISRSHRHESQRPVSAGWCTFVMGPAASAGSFRGSGQMKSGAREGAEQK